MTQKNIEIDGKWFSLETVKEALKKHCGFEEEEYQFQVNDVVRDNYEHYRICVVDLNDKPIAYSPNFTPPTIEIERLWNCGYRKIGELKDFLKERK